MLAVKSRSDPGKKARLFVSIRITHVSVNPAFTTIFLRLYKNLIETQYRFSSCSAGHARGHPCVLFDERELFESECAASASVMFAELCRPDRAGRAMFVCADIARTRTASTPMGNLVSSNSIRLVLDLIMDHLPLLI